MNNKVYSSEQLHSYFRCKTRRENEEFLNVSSKYIEENKNNIIKIILKKILKKEINGLEAKEYLINEFKKLDFPTSETARIHAIEAYDQIMRYISCESRNPIFLDSKIIDINGLKVKVKPDIIYIDDKTIEVIIIKTGKPKITQTGKKVDTSAKNNLGLYSLFCYGKELVKNNEEKIVKASYYYLRKKNDSFIKNEFDVDFFNVKGAGNIVFISDVVSKIKKCPFTKKVCLNSDNKIDISLCINNGTCEYKDCITELDYIFKPQIESFISGEIITDNCICEYCEYEKICNIKKIPELKEDVSKNKKIDIKNIKLTQAQKEAIIFDSGEAKINAGAGAGKTLVVSLRTINLLKKGIKPQEICLLTFTDNGAKEMTERINVLAKIFGINENINNIVSTTFNSFGNDIISKEYKKFGFTAIPEVIDDIDRKEIISEILSNSTISGLDYRNFDMDMKDCQGALCICSKAFEIIKKERYSVKDVEMLYIKMQNIKGNFTKQTIREILEIFDIYKEILIQRNLIEYIDQEIYVEEILKINKNYFDKYGFKHIIIDEFQDSSPFQIKIIKQLMECKSYESLMVVGDDSQSIFGFRNTSSDNIINLFKILDVKGKDFYLLDNYRSTFEIVDLANKVNNINKYKIQKILNSKKGNGLNPIIRGFNKEQEENDYIISQIKKHIEAGEKDIAYIASKRTELYKMASKLEKENIPYVMLNPEPIYENPNVIAAINLAKAFIYPNEIVSIIIYLNILLNNKFLYININNKKSYIEEIKNKIISVNNNLDQKTKLFHQMLLAINDNDEIYESFLERLSRKNNIDEELNYCIKFMKFGENILQKRIKKYNGIVLTTAHSSKGLEWSIVFNSISNYDSQLLRQSSDLEIEEKRRLLFVSITRAKKILYITGKYSSFGNKDKKIANMFLKELYDITKQEFPTTI